MKATIINYWISGTLIMMLLLGGGIKSFAQSNESFFTVSGIVKDSQNKKKLSLVNVSIPGTNVGTVTNADGEFALKVKNSLNAKEVEVSHIGYLNNRFPISGDESGKTVLLTPNSKMLNEVIIRPGYPRQLLEQAIDRIALNYSIAPNLFTGFYRETAQKGKRYIQISEAVINIYKDSYTQKIDKDRVRIFKGRKLLSPKKSDTLAVKLMGGPYLSILLDVVKNPEILLDKETLSYYEYRLEDPVSIDNRQQFVISFKPIVIMPYALYYGKYYLDRETLTFTRIEFNLDMQDRNKAIDMMLVKKPTGLRFRPSEFSFLVTYKQQNGISYLNYIRSEAKFKCDWKRRLFSSGFTLVSEMVTTERENREIQMIPYRESFKKDQSFSDKVTDFYDDNYWGAYNIIAPTESLEAAVKKLKKQQ